MSKKVLLSFLSIFVVFFITRCAQTMQYNSHQIINTYYLDGIPVGLVDLYVNDLRAEKKQSILSDNIKELIERSLSNRQLDNQNNRYKLKVDIIEHKSYFTLGNWNAITRFRITLIDHNDKILGTWNASGEARRSNMFGYATAKAVSQDAYNTAIGDMMSILSSISLPIKSQ